MKLPFLKESKPKRFADPIEDKHVNGMSSDDLDDQCSGELMEAVKNGDIKAFRSALEALVMNMFDWGNE